MRSTLSQENLSNLIGVIYDCALDPARWETALMAVSEVIESDFISLTLNDMREGRYLINKSVGWEPDYIKIKRDHVAEINARLKEWLAEASSLDRPFVASRNLSADYLAASPYVRECLAPQNIVDIVHFFLMSTPAHLSEIGIARHARQGLIDERVLETGRLLLPHLRRAVTISNVLDVQTIERDRFETVLNALHCAVLLVDERGMILHSNRAGEELMRDRGPVTSQHGLLRANSLAATKELISAVGEAVKDEAAIGELGLAVALHRPSEPPVYAHVLPISGGSLRAELRTNATAAIFIGQSHDPKKEAQTLASSFGLTAAETRVLEEVLQGRGLPEAAAALGIAPTTAKTHLGNIFAKTGVSRQAELVRLATRASSPARTNSASPK
ncbi:helix-turn-helix transcriptional regulator [Consotaella salsifontis]|uniref:Transcriptional regulator, LuxR family n=1 Tax=Consotaella salsifontis TaxID=1365950 RepID=A0A1T4TFX3_9HYPH|nr:helix-turn-helix transcriptional regulator [Consotaella salsifontis]SKA39109.1 transcriptional regulator, LuxR family [Consotaella salsifontis]